MGSWLPADDRLAIAQPSHDSRPSRSSLASPNDRRCSRTLDRSRSSFSFLMATRPPMGLPQSAQEVLGRSDWFSDRRIHAPSRRSRDRRLFASAVPVTGGADDPWLRLPRTRGRGPGGRPHAHRSVCGPILSARDRHGAAPLAPTPGRSTTPGAAVVRPPHQTRRTVRWPRSPAGRTSSTAIMTR